MDNLYKYGLSVLESIKFTRKIGFIDESLSIDENIKSILKKNKINFTSYKIIEKSNEKGFYMKWHLDDAQIINHNKDNNIKDQTFISNKKAINYKNNPPEYSMIIYESEYEKDFNGGILEFCDGYKIYPKKNMYVFFDSRFVHMVHKISDGVRVNYLIKFYVNIKD